MVAGIVFVALIFGVLGLLLPVGIGEPADPLNTPAHVKPEWYFLALYQLLKYIPKVAGVVLPILGGYCRWAGGGRLYCHDYLGRGELA